MEGSTRTTVDPKTNNLQIGGMNYMDEEVMEAIKQKSPVPGFVFRSISGHVGFYVVPPEVGGPSLMVLPMTRVIDGVRHWWARVLLEVKADDAVDMAQSRCDFCIFGAMINAGVITGAEHVAWFERMKKESHHDDSHGGGLALVVMGVDPGTGDNKGTVH